MDLIQLLVDKGASLRAKSESGATPLHLAVFFGHEDVVKQLVEAGAPLEEENYKNKTPLQLAADYGRESIAKYLAEKSGKPVPPMREKVAKFSEFAAPDEAPAPEQTKQ